MSRARLLGVLLCGLAVVSMAPAAEVPDDGLLEFLGSVDTEDKGWHDYLARTDIDKVARRPVASAGYPPAAKPPDQPSDPPASNPPPSANPAPPGGAAKPVTPP